MKAILISIKPQWVAKILNGEKTIEIRKTCPEIFKHLKPYEGASLDVYIYCTKDNSNGYLYYSFGKTILHDKYVLIKEYDKQCIIGNGKVVAKFTLNKVEEISYSNGIYMVWNYTTHRACITEKEMVNYLKHKKGYAWHISNLVIFDRPRELSEFYKAGFDKALKESLESEPYPICSVRIEKQYQLTKAPQSWCYIEAED